jgi:membrane protein required for colicin V production
MAFRGLFNGLVRELFSFGSLIIGLISAMAFYKTAAKFLTEQFGSHSWNEGISFFLIFIVVFVCLKMAEHTILKLMDETAAFSVDKGLGFLLGFLEGFIICSLVTYILDFQTFFDMNKILGNSFFVPYFSKIFPYLESTSSAVMNSLDQTGAKVLESIKK